MDHIIDEQAIKQQVQQRENINRQLEDLVSMQAQALQHSELTYKIMASSFQQSSKLLAYYVDDVHESLRIVYALKQATSPYKQETRAEVY